MNLLAVGTSYARHRDMELQERQQRAEQIDNRLREPGLEDWEEQVTQRENDEVLEALGNQAIQEIEQIKRALYRIEKGNYGVCSQCGGSIASERLKAMPFAMTCIRCI